jgi:predicted ferric reductase
MNPKLWWYIARAGGLVAWWLLAAAVVWGLLLSTRVAKGKPTPAWLLDLHRFLGGLAVIFTAVHVVGLMLDGWIHLRWTEVLVPLASHWRPVAVAWGTVSLYLIAGIELTSLLMRRLPRRLWRAVHSTSFLLFLVATVHTFSAGKDVKNVAVQWTALGMTAPFIFLAVYRALAPRRGAERTVARSSVVTPPSKVNDRPGATRFPPAPEPNKAGEARALQRASRAPVGHQPEHEGVARGGTEV